MDFQLLRTFQSRLVALTSFLLAICCLLGTAQGQLTVLSAGNADAQWRDAQIEALEQQVKSGQVKGQLKSELEARLFWLGKWEPAKLGTEPFVKAKSRNGLVEPTLDPSKKATGLRKRLFGPRAKPTAKDTKELEKLLSQHPADIGVRQLHLHWLDQRQYRKIYPDEIADAAQRLIGLIDQVKPQTQQLQLAKAFCLYRRGRALVYRELPDVLAKKPIKDAEAHEAKLQGTYSELQKLVGDGRPEFILLEIRMLRRDGWYGEALKLLESNGQLIDKQWYLKKRRDLLAELEWSAPNKEAAEIYAEEYPEEAAKEKAKSATAS